MLTSVRVSLPIAIATALVGVALCTRAAEVMWVVDAGNAAEVADTAAADAKRPFKLPSQTSEVTEALQDFSRQSKRAQWERAFRSLEKIQAAKPKGMIVRADGMAIPSKLYLRQMLHAMPSAGKDAYRVFHDAEAKKLLDEAKGAAELTNLNKLVDEFFICSVADVAADRLGDLYFEQGAFDQAAECWQSILDFRSDSALSRAQLLAKTGIAQARAGRWDDTKRAVEQLRQRHAGEKVTLAGREADPVEYLTALLTKGATDTQLAHATSSAREDLRLPTSGEPLWQFRFLNPAEAKKVASIGNDWGGAKFTVTEMVPATVVDDRRVYVNYLGSLMALDVENGKLVWRDGKLHELVKKLNNNNQMLQPEHYTLSVAGDILWPVLRNGNKAGNDNSPFRLMRYDANTGERVWNSSNGDDVKNWNFRGTPIASGDRVYMTAIKNNQGRELFTLALDAKTRKTLWSTQIGTAQVDESQMYHIRGSHPSMLLSGRILYVDTNTGGLLAIDTDTGAIRWGLAYEATVPNTDNWYNQPRKLATLGEPLLVDNVLYIKGMRSSRLYAIDVTSPKLLWSRPISSTAVLAGVDQERMYLAGEELAAIDLKTRKLLWSTRAPIATSWVHPLLTRGRLYQFTPRGIFEVDTATGDVKQRFRGADMESLGGVLLVSPKGLISVSNLAITAYAIDGAN